jgi:PPOX class probable F420-dependent enzyme
MKLPPLTDQELASFLQDGTWVAKIATFNLDGTTRMTPLTYAVDDEEIVFTTWEDSTAVRNLRRDPRASVLIDKVDQPYAGVHYTGQAQTGPETLTPQEYAQLFGRYIGDLDQAAQSYETLNSLGLGRRFYIRFRPDTKVTWDFGKIPGAGTDADPLRPKP